jgi:hypothetical protein
MATTLTGRNSIDTNFNGITALTVRATSTRLGSRGWRLSDTTHGKAVRRTRPRHAVKSNMPKVERVLPTLDDETALAIVRNLTTADTSATLNLNVHDK